MQVYQHEEEQIQALKQWWRQQGSLFLTVLTMTLIFAGAWYFWQYRQASHQQRAAVFYDHLQQQRLQHDLADQRLLSERLLSRYNDTLYAEYAALDMAKEQLAKDDMPAAKASLRWVIDHAKQSGAKHLASLRLARLFLMEKNPAEALVLLDQVGDSVTPAWLGFVRGQAYFMQKKNDLAEQAFTAARQALWSEDKQYMFFWINDMASDRSLLNTMINAYLAKIALDQAAVPDHT